MNNQYHSEGFKKAIIQKILGPDGRSLNSVAKESGLSTSTLFNWKRKYAKDSIMKKNNNRVPAIDWTADEKMEAIIETAKMSENELGEYLRSKGLNSCDLENFKKEFISNAPCRGRPKLDPEIVELRKNNTELKRDLNKKNKALAEMSARVILLKKSHLLWGEHEDDD